MQLQTSWEHDEHIIKERDVPLYCQCWRPNMPRGVVALLHGIGGHSGLFDDVGRYLADDGLSVCAMDLRGHGRSGGQRGHIDAWSDYRDDLGVLVDRLAHALSRLAPVRLWTQFGLDCRARLRTALSRGSSRSRCDWDTIGRGKHLSGKNVPEPDYVTILAAIFPHGGSRPGYGHPQSRGNRSLCERSAMSLAGQRPSGHRVPPDRRVSTRKRPSAGCAAAHVARRRRSYRRSRGQRPLL